MLSSLKGYMIAAGAVLIVALLVGVYFKGRYDSSLVYIPQIAAAEQKGRDQQAATDQTNTANNFVTKDAFNELQVKLAGYGSTINDLTQRLRVAAAQGKPIILPAAMAAACKPTDVGPAGTATPSDTAAEGPAAASTIPTEVLRDDLTLALQNIEALRTVIETSDRVQRH